VRESEGRAGVFLNSLDHSLVPDPAEFARSLFCVSLVLSEEGCYFPVCSILLGLPDLYVHPMQNPPKPVNRRRFLKQSALATLGIAIGVSARSETLDAKEYQVSFAFAEPWTDPSSDMAVSWVSNRAELTEMEFREVGTAEWLSLHSRRSRPFPALEPYHIHTCRLEGLKPATTYEFRWPGALLTETFRTTPSSDVRLACFSDYQNYDFGVGSRLDVMGRQVRSFEADMLVLNGDYINDDGRVERLYSRHWFDFLGGLSRFYRSPNGALLPLVAILGNHEGRHPQGHTNAHNSGANGSPGQIVDIFSWGYDPEQPQRYVNSASTFSIGSELFFVGIETNHTESLAGQIDWFREQLDRNAPNHRHVMVAGHAPGFICSHRNWDLPGQAKDLRNLFWPAMSKHADKVRCYLAGHEHVFAVTGKMRVDYDPSLSVEENDTRWAVDPVQGIRQIGSGPWGAHFGQVSEEVAGRQSSIDGSPRIIAAMGRIDRTGPLQVYGEGISNPHNEFWHGWYAQFSTDYFRVRAIGIGGQDFYQIEESVG